MRPKGFTLIELLVVITIIVVLLALLMPAMDKAIYQAELVQCGGKLNAAGMAVITYAFENNRKYPFRDLPPTRTGVGNPEHVQPNELVRPVNTYDMRPGIRDVLDINLMLQCPFTDDTLELDDTPPDEWVFASYTMWWGWLYWEQAGDGTRHKGMLKLGDRFAWQEPNDPDATRYQFNVLISDYDLYYGGSGKLASHPDKDGVMAPLTYRRVPTFGIPLTWSTWEAAGNATRGLLDLNFALTDGSVQRVNDIQPYVSLSDMDERMGAVPASWRNVQTFTKFQIPR